MSQVRRTPRVRCGVRRGPFRAVATRSDDGFILLESMIAIALVTIVVASLAVYFVGAIQSTNRNRHQQAAAQLVDNAIDKARAVGGATAFAGHDQTSTAALFAGALASDPTVSPWLATMVPAVDGTALSGAGATAVLPTVAVPQTVNGLTFNSTYFVSFCYRTNTRNNADCVRTQATGAVQYVRVVAVVSWSGVDCSSPVCSTVSAIILNGSADPVFNFNQAPPPSPVLAAIPLQADNVGDTVTGLSGIAGCTSACTPVASNGVPPYLFSAVGMPPGLAMNPAGLVTGTPTTTGTYTVSLTVTDAFLDTGTSTFQWRIYAAIAVSPNPVPAQASAVNSPATLQLTATGGSAAANLSWSVIGASLPPGLTISSTTGKISGTPTTAGSYNVVVAVTDSVTGSSIQLSFAWAIGTVVVNPPPAQTATVGLADSYQLTSAGGIAPRTWALIGGALPTGLTLAAGTGLISGTPTVAGAYTATVQVTEGGGAKGSGTIAWTVYNPPTITSPGNLTFDAGNPFSVQLANTCPSGSCTFALSGNPSWLSITAGGVVGGTTQTGSFTVTATITQSSGGTASTQFTIVVFALPTFAALPDRTTAPNTAVSVSGAATCPNAPCTYAFAGGKPTWLTVNATTGQLTGTTPATAAAFNAISLKVTDNAGASATSNAFTWLVDTAPTITTPANQTVASGSSVSLTPSSSCPGGGCRFTMSGNPGWLSISSTTGRMTGTATSSDAGMTVTITDAFGLSATTGSFSWTVYTPVNVTTPADQTSPRNTSTSLAMQTTGGAGTITWSATGLPPGLTINASSGVISGTPTTNGTYSVTVRATDSSGSDTATFNWTITSLTVTTPSTQTSTKGTSDSYQMQSTGGSGSAIAWSATGLPPGLTISSTSGLISGTPTKVGAYSVTVTGTDTSGTSSASFTWNVAGRLQSQSATGSNACVQWTANNGGDVEQGGSNSCNQTASSYQFVFHTDGTIESVSSAGNCLRAPNRVSGAVTMTACSAADPRQLWTINANGTITNVQGGTTYYLTLSATAQGTRVSTTTTGSPNSTQKWNVL